MSRYPEIESQGFTAQRRGKTNPHAVSTDHHRAWEEGAARARSFDAEIDAEVAAASKA